MYSVSLSEFIFSMPGYPYIKVNSTYGLKGFFKYDISVVNSIKISAQ